jgi:hypothetical protein
MISVSSSPSSSSASPSYPPGPASSSRSLQAQANAIDQLLTDSGVSRNQLRVALDDVSDCSNVDAGLAAIQTVAGQRNNQVRTAESLSVGFLPEGDALHSELISALQDSLQADQGFLSWAQDVQSGGCTGSATHDQNYSAAMDASDAATADKNAFLRLWNPIASQQSLTPRSEPDI